MEKRYQVFVSSTYADLRNERGRVIQTLMEMDCIPAGMELFPAANDEQWEFIKKVIDDCDYYLLIIGGRYGSTTPEGVSYTEKEYDYAIQRGMKVLGFLHKNPEEIPVSKSDIDPEIRKRLEAFREKVSANKLVKFWNSAEELPGLVALSLSKTIKTYPAVGWVRADQASSTELLSEVNQLRKRNAELEEEISRRRVIVTAPMPDLAPLNTKFEVSGTYTGTYRREDWKINTTWERTFSLLSPYLLDHPIDIVVKERLGNSLFGLSKKDGINPLLNDQDFQTIKIQLMAQGLVTVEYLKATLGGMALFWSLTNKGRELMLALRSVKASQVVT